VGRSCKHGHRHRRTHSSEAEEAENVEVVGEGGAWLASEDAKPKDDGALEGKEFRFGRSRDPLGDARTRTQLAIAVTSWFFRGLFFAEHSQLESAIVSPNAYRFY
jgi:hypothetical protein